MPLGDWNDVPGFPEWRYGLAVRGDQGLTVQVVQKHAPLASFEVRGKTWAHVHRNAQRRLLVLGHKAEASPTAPLNHSNEGRASRRKRRR